jgi:predicted metal-binding protein
MKKAGIVRCQQTEDLCICTTDLEIAVKGEGAFAETGPVKVIGIVSCGGCPGKRAVYRADLMARQGAEVVALASCIKKGVPINMPCPHAEAMSKAIRAKLPENVTLLNWTH